VSTWGRTADHGPRADTSRARRTARPVPITGSSGALMSGSVPS
jgi:hypothetical protein